MVVVVVVVAVVVVVSRHATKCRKGTSFRNSPPRVSGPLVAWLYEPEGTFLSGLFARDRPPALSVTRGWGLTSSPSPPGRRRTARGNDLPTYHAQSAYQLCPTLGHDTLLRTIALSGELPLRERDPPPMSDLLRNKVLSEHRWNSNADHIGARTRPEILRGLAGKVTGPMRSIRCSPAPCDPHRFARNFLASV